MSELDFGELEGQRPSNETRPREPRGERTSTPQRRRARRSDLAVIVAVRVVDVMAMTIDDVIDVTVVLDRLVTALRPVDVLRVVTFAIVTAVRGAHVSFYGPE